jgi:hypothetical protein
MRRFAPMAASATNCRRRLDIGSVDSLIWKGCLSKVVANLKRENEGNIDAEGSQSDRV